jgi:hypothetical protein
MSRPVRAITVVRTVEICRESKRDPSSHTANDCVDPVDYLLEQMDLSVAAIYSEVDTTRPASRRGKLMRIPFSGREDSDIPLRQSVVPLRHSWAGGREHE